MDELVTTGVKSTILASHAAEASTSAACAGSDEPPAMSLTGGWVRIYTRVLAWGSSAASHLPAMSRYRPNPHGCQPRFVGWLLPLRQMSRCLGAWQAESGSATKTDNASEG